MHDVKGAAHSDKQAIKHPLHFSLSDLTVLVLWLKTLLFCQPAPPRKNNHIG